MVLLRAFPLLLAAVLGACGGEPFTQVSLAQLVAQPQQWNGRQVAVSGMLRSYSEPRHYWIEDQGTHRVKLENDDGLATLMVGRRVSVRGRYEYSTARGRRILVSTLEPL